MDRYHIWFDLRPGVRDLDLAAAVKSMMEHLKRAGTIEGWELERRKLGFGPKEIGEWHCTVLVRDMTQLEAAFDDITPRTGDMEKLHAAVWSKVANFRSALYRDFPDPNRIYPSEPKRTEHEIA